MAKQEALVESLNATLAAGEALNNEVAAHAAWQQSDYSFQLTVLGCFLSVLAFCSISVDVLSLVRPMLAAASPQAMPAMAGARHDETTDVETGQHELDGHEAAAAAVAVATVTGAAAAMRSSGGGGGRAPPAARPPK
jgi:hypothetical protein